MLLVVNFHYVRPEGMCTGRGIHPVSPAELRRQLCALGEHFSFVSGPDIVAAARHQRLLPPRACLITFDDGLAEQCTYAVPVLDSLGVPAVFFCCSRPLAGEMLTVHKTHWLQAARSEEEFAADVQRSAATLGLHLPFEAIDEDAVARQYLYDSPSARKMKYVLNHMLSSAEYEALIDHIFQHEEDEEACCRQLYMSRVQIASLRDRHTLGSHGHSHRPLAAMAASATGDELSRSKRLLEEFAQVEIALVSYPYGGPSATSRDLGRQAARCGYAAGFTMERCVNLTMDEPFLLGRLSTPDAPGGRDPLLVQGPDGWHVRAPMTWGRRWHLSEGPL